MSVLIAESRDRHPSGLLWREFAVPELAMSLGELLEREEEFVDGEAIALPLDADVDALEALAPVSLSISLCSDRT